MSSPGRQWRLVPVPWYPAAFFALLGAVTNVCASAELKQDSRFLRRPTLARPVCSDPKPYNLENWTARSNMFYVALSAALGKDEAEREAVRLARKHRFAQESGVFLGSQGFYELAVSWLEPEQIAALRCEDSVGRIDVVEEVQITIHENRSRATEGPKQNP